MVLKTYSPKLFTTGAPGLFGSHQPHRLAILSRTSYGTRSDPVCACDACTHMCVQKKQAFASIRICFFCCLSLLTSCTHCVFLSRTTLSASSTVVGPGTMPCLGTPPHLFKLCNIGRKCVTSTVHAIKLAWLCYKQQQAILTAVDGTLVTTGVP